MRTAFLLCLIPVLALSQVSITENFSDGDFTQNPTWLGDTAFFKVNPALQLQLKDSVAGQRYLSTASPVAANASWGFFLQMDFNPSGSNFAKVYLMSDQVALSGPLNGYFVRLGGSSADRISLFRQTGATETLVTESSDDWVDTDPVKVRVQVIRNANNWTLQADTSGGSNFANLAMGTDSAFNFSTHFGWRCNFTLTRSDKFFLDDLLISGLAVVDSVPPKIERVEVLDSVSLKVEFSETVDSATATNVANYLVLAFGQPVAATLDSSDRRQVQIFFPTPLQPRTAYQLVVSNVQDRFGNSTSDTASFLWYRPLAGDVVINELMVDPTPVVGLPPNALPEREYIELYNQSGFSISLKNWVLQAGSSVELLPDFTLEANSFVVLTKDDGVPEFPSGTPLLGLDMSGVALTNSGATVSLTASGGEVVSSVSYTDDWYADENKDDGGWSLEQVDPTNRCGGASNWRASLSPMGGTPGKVNSVLGSNPDTTRPRVERVSIDGDSSVVVHFSEGVDPVALEKGSTYEITPALVILSATALNSNFDKVRLLFFQAIDSQLIYELSLNDFPEDCSGNPTLNDTLIFAVPQQPAQGEILINEVLFNPTAGGSDFVELYNNSNKIFDLAKLRLGNWDAAAQTGINLEQITEESYLFAPGRYLVLTEDVNFLKSQYTVKSPTDLVDVSDLPSLSDDEGSIAVVTSNLKTLDYFEYSKDMHLPVLNSQDGVSLERLSFAKPAQDDDNWHSASETAGFATPGYENSQMAGALATGKITLEPKVFSPNQDGYHDFLRIGFNFENNNTVVSITVWSSGGNKVRELQNQVAVGTEGFFTWDGTNDRGELQGSGIYIVVVEYFNENGASGAVRETCVLSL